MEMFINSSTSYSVNSDDYCDKRDNSGNFSQCPSSPKAIYRRYNQFTLELTATILLLSIGFTAAYSSKDVAVTAAVPKEAELSHTVDMTCKWEINGGKSLYSVKWYKDGHEFFRFVPDNHPRIQTFQQLGVKLDKMSSRENAIRLMDVSLESTGQYKCEVSTEGPAFATAFKTGNLTVISPPKRGPEITGLSPDYAVGENVTANCSAWPSIPTADLHWTINGIRVPLEHTVVYPPYVPGLTGGSPSTLGLRFEAEQSHFAGGIIKIQCVAAVGSTSREAVRHVQMAHVKNQRLSAGDLRGVARDDANRLYINALPLILIVLLTT